MSLESLEPIDEWSIKHATYVMLKPCPFCGGEGPLPLSYINRERVPPVYRIIVVCANTDCGAETWANSRDLADARARAIERWQRRPA